MNPTLADEMSFVARYMRIAGLSLLGLAILWLLAALAGLLRLAPAESGPDFALTSRLALHTIYLLVAVLAPLAWKSAVALGVCGLAILLLSAFWWSGHQEGHLWWLLAAAGVALCLKALLAVSTSVLGTLLWGALGAALLGLHENAVEADEVDDVRKAPPSFPFEISRMVLSAMAAKAIVVDAHFVLQPPGAYRLLGGDFISTGQWLAMATVAAVCFVAADAVSATESRRDGFWMLGMWVLAFEIDAVLYALWPGSLTWFELMLSACWLLLSVASIVSGVLREVRALRLFGMALLGATALKACCVDLWFVGGLAQLTMLVVLGFLMLLVPPFYEYYRDRLLGPSHMRINLRR